MNTVDTLDFNFKKDAIDIIINEKFFYSISTSMFRELSKIARNITFTNRIITLALNKKKGISIVLSENKIEFINESKSSKTKFDLAILNKITASMFSSYKINGRELSITLGNNAVIKFELLEIIEQFLNFDSVELKELIKVELYGNNSSTASEFNILVDIFIDKAKIIIVIPSTASINISSLIEKARWNSKDNQK